jgi:hypothetical protein
VTENAKNTSDLTSSKVAALIKKYDFDDSFGDELEAAWTADKPDRKSLRELAEMFNHRVLKSQMTAAGLSTLDGEVSNIYRLLTAEEVSSGMKIEAKNRLKQNGIDVEELKQDFISYQAMRSYLKRYRGAEYVEEDEHDRAEKVLKTVQRLRSRVRSVTTKKLDQLRETKQLALGDYRLFVDIDVLCEDCGMKYSISELLERKECDCGSEERSGIK